MSVGIRLTAAILFAVYAGPLAGQTASVPAKKPLSDAMLMRVRPVIDAIYRLDYPVAENLCQRIIQDYPEHPAGYVYCERVYFSRELSKARLLSAERALGMDLFSGTPKFTLPVLRDADALFERTAQKATSVARLWMANHPGDLSGPYLLGSAYAFKSSYEVSIRQSRLSASGDAAKTFKVLKDLVREHREIVDARALTGAFGVVADSLDLKTKLLAALFLGIHGDLNAGRRDMEDAAERGFIENDDARLLLSILYAREKRFDEAMTRLVQLHNKYPENFLVHLDMAALDLISGKPAAALDTYREILAKEYAGLERSVVLCRMGVTARISGDLAQSERWLRDAVATPDISGPSLAITGLELGKTLDLEGQRAGAVEQYRRVLKGSDILGTQADARQWILRPYDVVAMKKDSRGGGLITLDAASQ